MYPLLYLCNLLFSVTNPEITLFFFTEELTPRETVPKKRNIESPEGFCYCNSAGEPHFAKVGTKCPESKDKTK
jgi:hypothetical protein